MINMVAVRRVKLVIVMILAFVGFMGLYQLEKRQQILSKTRFFSNGKLKISWQRHKAVTLTTTVPSMTPKDMVITAKRTMKTNSQRVVPTALISKVSNINPEEEEEELLDNEIDDTLDWIKRMNHEKQVNQESRNQNAVTELRDSRSVLDEILPTVNDEPDVKTTEVRDSNLDHSLNKIFLRVNDGNDSNKHNNVELRNRNAIPTVNGNSPSIGDEHESKQIEVTDLRDNTDTSTKTTKPPSTTIATTAKTTISSSTAATTATTAEATTATTTTKPSTTTTTAAAETTTTTTPPPPPETTAATATTTATTTTTTPPSETTTTAAATTTTTTPPPVTTAAAATTTTTTPPPETTAETTTTHQSFSSLKVQPNTHDEFLTTESNPNEKTTRPPKGTSMYSKGTSMYSPSPLPRVNTCNLPKLDPWDSSVRHLLMDVGFDPNCKSWPLRPLYDMKDNRLVLRDNSSLSGTRLNSFSLETIHRIKDNDNDFDIKSEFSPINVSSNEVYRSRKILKSDFFRIRYQIEGKDTETYYYARVVPRQDVMKKSEEIRQMKSFSKKSLPLNVLILGFDSTSNANFLRKMPRTLKWLRTQMRTYFMKGYSIVGDATTPALTALLTGNHEYDLPEGRRGYDGSEPIDRWPWISKMYESHGYVTLYSEDDPPMSTFNLRLNGFVEPPYHHFMRPFWLAIENQGLRDGPGICSRDMSLANYTMEYLLSFFEAYKETPKFAMGFLSYLTHARPNHLSYGDFDVLYFLNEMKSRGFLDNTLLVTFGDHGSRNDDVRSTMQGKLEERLPWLSISVPDWLESRYPELAAALANNENIISSPFDLHTTFRHILTYPDMPDNSKTYRSLLTNMSRDRTCKDAGIDEHWCPCLQFKPIDVKNQDVQQAALAVVHHINKLLNSTHTLRMSCHMIKLTAVHNAMQYEPNEKVQKFSSTNQDTDREVRFGTRTRDDQHFLVTIETSPKGALFEATVTMGDDKSVFVNPNISRINLYGNQPNCIAKKYPYLRKYCVCKKGSDTP